MASMTSGEAYGVDVSGMPDLFGPWARRLGFRVVVAQPDRVEVRWDVTAELTQPFGIINGGAHASATEALSGFAAGLWLWAKEQPADQPLPALTQYPADWPKVMGVSNHTDFYRGESQGTLTSVATPVHRGRSNQVWQVVTTRADGKLVARGQLRLHNP